MTQKEKTVIDFIKKSTVQGNIPSIREICKNTGIASTSTVWSILSSLEKQGYISRSREKSRGIKLANFKISLVPLMAQAEGTAMTDYVPFPEEDVEKIFAVRASKDIGEIKKGDIVFFAPCYVAPPNAVVAFETDDGMEVGTAGENGILRGRMIGFTRVYRRK